METTMPPPPSPNDHDNTDDDGDSGAAPQAGRNQERAHRRLTRSRDDRMIGGVASGIAQTYGFDVALVRVACAVLALFTFGTAVGAYLIGWLLIPEAGSPSIAHQYMARRGRRGNHDPAHRSKVKFWIAIVLLVIGIDALGDLWSDGWSRFFGPMVLITIGIAILVSRRDDTGTDTDTDGASHHVRSDEFHGGAPHGESERHSGAPQWPTRPHVRSDQTFESDVIPGMVGNESHRHDYRAQRRAARHERRQSRSHITGLTLSVLMLLTGGAWLIDSANIARVSPGAVQAIALCIVGVALIVSAWYGRARLLIPVAFILTMSCVIVAALDVPLSGGAGERKHLPVTATDVKARYQLGVGHLVVNLTSVQGAEALTTEIVQGIGQVEVLVPKDADVFVTSHIGVGDIVVLSNTQEGLYREQRTMHSDGTGRTIRLNIRVGIGEIRVRRASPPIDERTSVVTKTGVAQ